MMELDLKMADMLVEMMKTKHCSTYGHVASIAVRRDPSPFALVETLRLDHTEEDASHCHDPVFGNAVLIRSEHKSEQSP